MASNNDMEDMTLTLPQALFARAIAFRICPMRQTNLPEKLIILKGTSQIKTLLFILVVFILLTQV